MLSKQKAIIILNLLFLLTINLYAQNFSYKMFTVKDGLPGNSVFGIFEDSRGYIWINTNGGLSRYDGSTFKNYGINDGLPSYYSCLRVEDSAGRLWLAYKEGICTFDGISFTHYPIEDPPDAIWITQLMQTRNNKMRFCTGKGVYELQNKAWKKLNINTSICNLYELNDGSSIISYRDSLLIVHQDGSHKIIIRTDDDNPIIQSISCYDSYHYYVSTRNHLYIVNTDRQEKIHDDVLHDKSILNCYLDKKNRLWVGTIDNGIYVFEGNNYQNINPPGLNLKLCSVSCEDYEGNIWAATANGLMKLTPSWVDFYTKGLNAEDSSYTAAFKDYDGTLYFSHILKGFETYRNGKFTSSQKLLDKSSVKMTKNWVHSFARDEKNRLWLVDNNNDLLRITGSHCENKSEQWHFNPNAGPLLFDRFDNTMYAGNLYGLSRIKNDVLVTDSLFNRNTDRVRTISPDLSGNMWIGTERGKIYEKCNNNYAQMNNQLKVDSVVISKLFWSDAHTLWIATEGKGVYKFHKTSSGKFESFHITVRDGLPYDDVLDMAFDKDQCLWVSTLTGLARIRFFSTADNEKFSVTKFGSEEGFRNDNLTYSCLITDNDGNVWYGTSNYLARIHCNRIFEDTIPPIIHIEDVKLFNTDSAWNKYASSFTPFFHLPQNPVLPHDQNDIAIEYKAISFSSADNLIYQYKLEGVDKDWSSNGNLTHISFGNLPPGTYTFKVRAKKPLSAWSLQIAQFPFTITPPWWNTWWFITFIGLVIAFIIYLLYRFRLQQILRFQIIRNKIASDLHDDIGSTLQSISVYSEVAKQKSFGIIPELEEIGESSRRIIESMGDIVWTINPANDSFEKIIFRMKSHAYNLLHAKKIEFTFRADENLNYKKLSMDQRRNFYLIFKEALNNIVKYSATTRASIILSSHEKIIKLSIKDNGCGFDMDQIHEGNGLKNMYRRAKEMNGQIKIESQPGNGTHLELRINIK